LEQVKKIFLIILLATSVSLSVAAPFKKVQADTTVDKNTLKKMLHWVSVFTMYSNVDLSDKVDLQQYAGAADLLQSYVQNPELSVRLNSFRQATFVNVYPKGMLNGPEWILKKLNEISEAQYSTLNAPYLTIEVWFTPDATASSYTVTALFKTTDTKLTAAVAKVNPTMSSALVGKTYAQPRLAKNDVNKALFAALDALQTEIGEAFAPNIAVSYNNQLYTHNQTIEVWQKANEGITLQAVDRNSAPLTGTLTWTGVVGSSTSVKFPIGKTGLERISLRRGADQISLLVKVKEFSFNPEDILKQILIEAINDLVTKARKDLSKVREDSTNVETQLNVVQSELDARAGATELTSAATTEFFEETIVDEREGTNAELENLRKDVKVNSFIELNRKRFQLIAQALLQIKIEILLQDLIKNNAKQTEYIEAVKNESPQLIADLIINVFQKPENRTSLKDIFIGFLNKQINEVASR
jgi:hypothetical protein